MSEEILQAQERLLAATESKSLGNGDNEGWVSIEILPTTQKIISQVICRLFVGKTLSRDIVFTQKVADISYTTIICSIVLDWCPSFLRSSIARALPIKKYKGAVSNALRTDILTCLDQSRSKGELAGAKDRADNGVSPLCVANYFLISHVLQAFTSSSSSCRHHKAYAKSSRLIRN